MDSISPFSPFIEKIAEILKEHYVTELFYPLFVGVVAALFFHKIIIFEIAALFIATSLTFMILTYRRARNAVKDSVYTFCKSKNEDFETLVNGTNEFFCTSIVPTVLINFSAWFEADMIVSLSFVAKRIRTIRRYRACRIFLFEDEKKLRSLKKDEFYDGTYAKKVASIHRNVGMDLAYLPFEKFNEICSKYLNKIYSSPIIDRPRERKRCDFVVFRYSSSIKIYFASDIKTKSFVNPICRIDYDPIDNDHPDKEQYSQMMNKLQTVIYDARNRLKQEYDFHYFLFRR